METPRDSEKSREWLKKAFSYALQRVNGKRCVMEYFETQKPIKHWKPNAPVHTIAIGKAACAMAQGASEQLGNRLASGLIITGKRYHSDIPPSFTWIEGNHPIPNRQSLAAGDALIHTINTLPAQTNVLMLISGGTSAMVEVPSPNIKLSDLRKINQWLIGSGLDIQHINAVRKQLSQIKGGQLAQHLIGRKTLALYISDVINDDLASIGSGLLQPSKADDTYQQNLPPWLQKIVTKNSPPPPPQSACFQSIQNHIIANNRRAKTAVHHFASQHGINSIEHHEALKEDIQHVADKIANALKKSATGLHVWGGEPSIALPSSVGIGGRNQALALAVAQRIQGEKKLYFLSAGTDGIDGNSHAAGAIISGNTIKKAQAKGMAPDAYQQTASSGRFFEETGEALICETTHSNVMDLMLALKN